MMASRLREARNTAGFPSAAAAAAARGWTPSTYTSHENATRGFGVDEAKKYARAFRVNPGWLLALDQIKVPEVQLLDSDAPVKEVLWVQGAVAAGVWREQIAWPKDEWYQIEVGPPPRAGLERFAVRMDGYSMDRTIPPGSNLEAIRVAFGEVSPQDGDLVIVERRRHDLVEMTCKRLVQNGEMWELHCESTRAEFRDLVLPIGAPDAEALTDDETRVVGIVVNAQQSHFRRRI
ncbi:S24 family peptidase [Sphingomonas sp. RP10(2022)]|uniref:S24 family peptidase n=1 Tax=Sphingomonas liriopis TaxID=2949094 RepID=A0A9X2HTL9_9SPHN|nr:S24 family peptidase [Sphingomonas liriopis]MCP3735652.1 S24 family peptidase [Sphingomonas liriopis]